MEGSWNRRRREREHIHILLGAFQLLLVGNPESLLLIHDEQTQILPLNALG